VTRHPFVIFDFDGTLADSFPWFVNAFDEAAERFQFEKLDRSRLEAARALDAGQLLTRHGIPLWKVPAIARYMRSLQQRDIASIPLFPGIDTALAALQKHGIRMVLMTSNSRDNVLRVLGPQNAARFLDLHCGSSLFGKGVRLRRLLAADRIPPEAAIFVGDEIRDLKAAEQAGIAFGAVGWGYTHLHALVAQGARETFACVDELVAKLTRNAQ
jgi:phosphoglycolate phosphatase